ncbi:transcriptional regulator, TetR family [Saccharopolyspora kobensis]|uniref:Transcriptional regulator, TetR family n=1 Tax=Saccharopolyspora kobensis TaxID=146035 RepID=A0A1H6BL07_9PSEU|nr:TetR/AcrR family transcriptional regulator [Saccharopolyspora kobensis]SEG61067.1 transcriptional regulator, TetR family [Saccharopolyspora kobensis]SFE87511.1 transcriptional regulator, TetR family [Saccharopolyspora kobensis]
MPRTRVDTSAEIRAVAAELFARQGFEKTSLREVAERLGITKAALYYHFASKADLVRGIVQPLVDEVEALLAESGGSSAEQFLADYFDVVLRHRQVYVMVFRDIASLAQLDLMAQMLDWRDRTYQMLVGEDATPAQIAKATVAIGGLQDCALTEGPPEHFRDAALAAAIAALRS